MNAAPKRTEAPHHAARPCVDALPYRAIVYLRSHGNGTPLYAVAGKAGGPWGADEALRTAFDAHGGTCFYCAKKLTAQDVTIDHVEARKLNGGDAIQNLVLACKPCNVAKSHTPIEAFKPEAGKAWLQALLIQVEERLKKLG